MFQVKIKTQNGKIIEGADKVRDIFSSLNDGYHFITVEDPNLGLTPRDCQNAYFLMIDICAKHAGNTRYDVHEYFKAEEGIATTKDLDVETWRRILKKFQWFAFNNYDCFV